MGRIGLPQLEAGVETVELISAPTYESIAPLLLTGDAAAETLESLGLSTGEDSRFFLVSGLTEGVYTLRFTHNAAAAAVAPPPPFKYAAELLPLDTKTSGDWVGKYGSAGYYIFNASTDGGASDLTKLPRWAKNVWAPTTEDSKDPVTTGGEPPLDNARELCPPPFHPDTDRCDCSLVCFTHRSAA